MKYKPHAYQEYTTNKIILTNKIIAILEMGLGKTVSTLTALEDLMYNRFEVEKVLVIAPLKVADFTWMEELDKWDHLKHLSLSKIIGSEKDRIAAIERQADIYTINRENTKWLVDYFVKQKKWPFDCLVIDESSSFKNHQSQRFKALKKVAAITKHVILLTGTPAPNSLLDIWPQMYLIDQGQRLGRTITEYRNEYFNPGKRNQHIIFNYVSKPGAEKKIYEKISDVAVSLKAVDHLKMPERIDNHIKIKMPKDIKAIYDKLETEYILELDEENISAMNAAAVMNKLLQLANGAVYADAIGLERKVVEIHKLKLEALKDIIEDNEGKPIMVFYNYQHDLMRLKEYFKELKPRELKTIEDKQDWDNGKIQLLLAHPKSMGHGLNLQAGGHIIVWFGLTWSLEEYLQANARLDRQGQTESVIINHLIVEGTVDETVMERIAAKKVSQDDLINAVKAKIKAIKSKKF